MKKIIAIILIGLMITASTACGSNITYTNMEPKVSQMKAICELAVMECYYHNVAKFKEDETGILFWKKSKNFWVEYSGVVKLGIDVSKVSVQINGEQISISIPEAQVLGCEVDSTSLTEESFIVSKDPKQISASDEVEAFKAAQEALEATAASDSVLLAAAQQRAQSLLEEYIINIGNAVGKKYNICWVYLDEEGTLDEVNSFSEVETGELQPA